MSSLYEDQFWQYSGRISKANLTNVDDDYNHVDSFANGSFLTCQNDTYYTNEPIEPTLLEELEIYPERIMKKSIAMLNPFRVNDNIDKAENVFKENDLAGPIMFCVLFAVSLFLLGNKTYFGYIYSLSLVSVISVYSLISLMCNSTENYISISGVASILGYSLLPIVFLSFIGVFMSLYSIAGHIACIFSVYLSTMTSSRMLCLMIGNPNQRFLLAYPCALIYVIFVILIFF